ncbi:DUF3293 domain-containing protein [Inquilinus sp. CAU 1745]|uniref:DUF3293 domain-containing protein n=1 Tax=Inquilinus sp. CAU 1745 TaxID=3140369 RepID=UPI00325B2D3F
MPDTALIDAYHGTRYIAHDGELELTVTIGQPSTEIDALFSRLNARTGTFITAWNPRSIETPEEENRLAGTRLDRMIRMAGLTALPHLGVGEDPEWTPEEGLFVLDLPLDRAIEIAAIFDQHAIVTIEAGEAAELHLLGPMAT